MSKYPFFSLEKPQAFIAIWFQASLYCYFFLIIIIKKASQKKTVLCSCSCLISPLLGFPLVMYRIEAKDKKLYPAERKVSVLQPAMTIPGI